MLARTVFVVYASVMFSYASDQLFILFFLQAEDGIRDLIVTGVQTCALPISPGWAKSQASASWAGVQPASSARSEERRVGKECRSRGSPYHYKKNSIYLV